MSYSEPPASEDDFRPKEIDNDVEQELAQIEQAIAWQEATRDLLPDDQKDAVEVILIALRQRKMELLAHAAATVKGSGAVAQGPGATAVGERGVHVGGRVGGSVVTGDNVNQVGGDQIEVGDISGSSGIAIGREAQAHVQHGVSGQELARIFATVYQKIEQRPEDPDVDREEIVAEVQRIEKEAAKNEQASPNRLERWLRNLANMAPDILDVIAASLGGPVSGATAVLAKIIDKVRSEPGLEIGE